MEWMEWTPWAPSGWSACSSWTVCSWLLDHQPQSPFGGPGPGSGSGSGSPLYHRILLTSIVGLVCALIFFVYSYRKWKLKERAVREFGNHMSEMPRGRFRKRDKMLFYGRRIMRKVKWISGTGQGRKRRAFMRFAKRLLHVKKEQLPTQLKVLEPPAEYLEEDLTNEERVPPDALYMLRSIRVFGYFEKPVFLKLCKHTEIITVSAGSFLFKIGDPDENVYIVQSGKLNVYIKSPEGNALSLKVVKAGDSVTSLLSFMDVLTGHPQPYKTVSAKALEDSQVIKLPMASLQKIFQEYPDLFIKVMQIIMVRLQRVTFTALHQYLGLSAELVNPGREKKRSSVVSASPQKARNSATSVQSSLGEMGTFSPADSSPRTNPSLATDASQGLLVNSPLVRSSRHPDPTSDGGSNMNSTPDIQIPPKIFKRPDPMDEESLISIATEAFVKELGLENDELLSGGQVQIREVPAGTYLMKEESHKDVALVYVLSGSLTVSQKVSKGDHEVHMFTAYPGETVGGLAVLTGEPSFFTIKTKHFSRIGILSKNTIYSIMREKPKVVLHIAHSVVKRLSPFVRQVDFALDWMYFESGRAVYRQDDESDSTFIVLSGRLRSVITYPNGKKELVGEYGKGDLVGIVEMVTQTKRGTTVMAVRDSELAKLPEGLFNAIKLRFPVVVTRLINLLGHRILGSWQKPSAGLGRPSAPVDGRSSQMNFSTVAIVPVTDDVPLTAFTYELYHSLSAICPTLRLTSDVVRKTLGISIMDIQNEYLLNSWLAQEEDKHQVVLYQCDANFSHWTQRCIRQADCILIVGLGSRQPSIGKIEKEVERLAIRTQKELVLLHREGGPRPQGTVDWLNMRAWVSCHHHIVCQNRMFTRKSQYRITELYNKVLMSEANIHSDFSRLARWLTGTSVGLVLGGGGARGAAHVGMIKSIQEAGIPIDMVGGVSIGAFMGALWCSEKNITTVTQKAREWSKKMTQWSRQVLDLTYPSTSMFSGRHFNTTIRDTFEVTHIEDLWLPYFTITTDITASCMRIHRHGSLWRYVRASMSLSGYMPPLCDPVDGHLLLDGGYVNNLPGDLWRYCRASMSIAGIFPPLCDPTDGHLLLDGCYVNNVPADIMRAYGARHILAIDVGSQDDMDLTNYGDDLSGWWLLWKKWNPFTTPVKVPNLPDIQSRLAYVSCVRQLEEVKNSDYCEYIRPPIDKYKTLQFGSFDEIKDVGYQHGRGYFEGQKRRGALPILRQSNKDSPSRLASPQHHHTSEYTFTDLAQMVCRVAPGSRDPDNSSDESDDDGREMCYEGYASEPTAGILDDSIVERRKGGSLSLSENELDSETEMRYMAKSRKHNLS